MGPIGDAPAPVEPVRTMETGRAVRAPRVRKGHRLVARVLVLVMVPLAVLVLQAVRTAADRSRTAHQAEQVVHQGDALIAVIRVGFAVGNERRPVITALQARSLGLSYAAAAALLGLNASTWVADARAATDAELVRLPSDARLQTVQDLVRRLRSDQDRFGISPDIETRLLDVQRASENHAKEMATDLARQTADLFGSSSISRDVLALQLTYQASLLQDDIAEGLFTVSANAASPASPTSPASSASSAIPASPVSSANAANAASPASSSAASSIEKPDQLIARSLLIENEADYQALATEIQTLGSQRVRTAWDQILNSPGTARLYRSIQQALNSPVQAGDKQARLAARIGTASLYKQILEGRAAHAQLVETASDVVLGDIRAMRTSADSAYRTALLAASGVVLLVLAGAFLLSRGVTRPLREIAERAYRLRDGDLSFDAAAGRGPREVVAVGQAFNDVVSNLRLLEEQATALSDGVVHHEALLRRVPGKLGSSLHASLARLSQSIEAREELETRLRHEATHDRLTGLLNRSSAIVALEQGVARAHRVGGGLAVLMVDLDGLKRINDASGHSTGDAVLRRAAGQLAKAVRGGDIVARLGADEFMVMAEVERITDAVELGQRIVSYLSGTSADLVGPIPAPRSPGTPLTVSASVGVSITLDGRATLTSLMQDADAAVRSAKDAGGGRLELFDEELRRQLAERSTIEAALSAAMTRGDLELHYQPIVAPDGRMAGMEALCRWTDPVLGEVSPAVFVNVAEASDLVIELDRWVLQEATRQLAEWQHSGQLPGVYLSVNLSGRHLLSTGVVGDVRAALAESGVDARALVLEITETVLLDDLLVAAQNLTELRELGIRVAVDDFGTGYTSIAHLQRLPVDIIKIDRSFVADLTSTRGHSLVRLMVDMATTLGLGLVAEGVETPTEMQYLMEMGCPLMQGHLLGRAMIPSAIPRWVSPVTVHHLA